MRWQWIVEAAVVGTNTSVTCDVDTPGGEAGHRYRGRLAGLQLYRRLPTTTTSFPSDVGGSAGYFGIDDCESGTADPTAARMPRRLIANESSWPIGYTQLDVSGTDELAGGLDKLLQRPITYPTRIIQAFQPRVADIAAQGSGLDPELGRRGWFTYFPMICSAIFGIMSMSGPPVISRLQIFRRPVGADTHSQIRLSTRLRDSAAAASRYNSCHQAAPVGHIYWGCTTVTQ